MPDATLLESNENIGLKLDLISQESYTEIPKEQGSPEFNRILNTVNNDRKIEEAPQGKSTQLVNKDVGKILFSDWHTVCFDILVIGQNGDQIHHVNPNVFRSMSGSTISQEQLDALDRTKGSNAIIIDSRGNFAYPEREDLKDSGLTVHKIKADSQKWRSMYDQKTGELWIDRGDKRVLRKYKVSN